jgi:hypothetical protein
MLAAADKTWSLATLMPLLGHFSLIRFQRVTN